MSDQKYRFYDDYDPSENVSKSLNDPSEDYNLAAPYRDLLGILESEEIWSEKDAVTADDILEKLSYWDENNRQRSETPPDTTRTIRNQLDDLYQDYLVLKIKESGKANKYWKIPDDSISHPLVRKFSKYISKISNPLEYLLYRHEVVTISVFLYIVGSIAIYFHPIGLELMIASGILFIIGHFMAYRGTSLLP